MPASAVVDNFNPVGNAQAAAHLPQLLAGKLRSPVSVKHQPFSDFTTEAYAFDTEILLALAASIRTFLLALP